MSGGLALDKEAVADVQFVERSLPSVTLGKAFAECKIAFAECLRHSAKELCPVVTSRNWKNDANKVKLISRFDWIDCGGFNRPYPFIYIKGGGLDLLQVGSRVNLTGFANKSLEIPLEIWNPN